MTHDFVRYRKNRYGHDGWALRHFGWDSPIYWTTCATRAEARKLKRELELEDPDLFYRLEIVKVRIDLRVVGFA